jgi:hypothetical protein
MATVSRHLRPGSVRRRGERHRRPPGCGASLVAAKLYKPWRSRVLLDGRICHLGYFETAELAREAYAEAIKARLGEQYLQSDAERKIGELTKKMPKATTNIHTRKASKSDRPTLKTKQAALAEMGVSKQDAC